MGVRIDDESGWTGPVQLEKFSSVSDGEAGGMGIKRTDQIPKAIFVLDSSQRQHGRALVGHGRCISP